MHLRLRREPRLFLGQECTVCLRYRNAEDIAEALIDNAMFGVTDPYAACPSCHREVFHPLRDDAEYRRRVRVFLFVERGVVLREP